MDGGFGHSWSRRRQGEEEKVKGGGAAVSARRRAASGGTAPWPGPVSGTHGLGRGKWIFLWISSFFYLFRLTMLVPLVITPKLQVNLMAFTIVSHQP